MSITRRKFVQGSVVTVAAAGLPLSITARVRGANDQLRVAVCGVRARGDTHIDWATKEAGAKIVALVDCDTEVLEMRAAKMAKNKAMADQKPEKIQDYRKVLERKDIDVLSIATPNHWHVPMTIQGLQAGKDVYVEKPISHTVWEGRQLVHAAKKYGKIVQTGAQSRSQKGTREAAEFVQSGALGKIKYIVATCYKPRPAIGKRSSALEIPSTLDYDLWCGPAAKRELFRDQLHYDWHWDFNTGNGDLGNQGVHEMDRARMFAGHKTLSPRVWALGGRFYNDPDAGDTPNSEIVFHDYPEIPIIFEVRGLPKSKEFQNTKDWKAKMDGYDVAGKFEKPVFAGFSTVVVYCENGTLISGSYNSGKAIDKEGKTVKTFSGSGSHWGNFAEAVKSRNRALLNNNEEEGHLSAGLCHTGNISYLMGKKMTAAEIREQVKGNAAALERFESIAAHIKANGFDVDSKLITMGPILEMDVKTEKFTNNAAANKLLRREYRKGFEVPEIA